MRATRAIGIVRVSQRDKDALSPEVQRRAIIALAAEHGWSLRDEDIFDENLDANGKVRNVSGSWALEDRPKLRYAIEEVENGRAQVIVSERFDRMFRNEILRRMVVKRLEEADGQLWARAGQMTNQRAEGRLAHNVNGDVSEYTLETAKERSWDAVEVAIENGKSPGLVPPGLVRGKDGVLKPAKPEEVAIVREAFELRAGGAPVSEVRTFLASHGIKRTISGVRKMLVSRLYVGEIHFGGHTPNLKAHDGIIDRDLFDRVGKMVVSAGRRGKSERLLARLGVLRCGTCGGRMSADSSGTAYPFYRCANDECTRRVTITAEMVEKAVIEAVIEHRRSLQGRARGEQKAQEAQEAAEQAEDRLQTTILLLEDFGDLEATHQKLAVLRDDAERKRESADRLAAAYPPMVTVDVEAVFDSGTLEEKRRVIRDTIERISIAPGRGPQRITIDLLGK